MYGCLCHHDHAQVEMAFQIGAAVTGDVSQGLSWRPLPMDKATGMGGFMAMATEPDSPEAQGLFAYLKEVGKEGGPGCCCCLPLVCRMAEGRSVGGYW